MFSEAQQKLGRTVPFIVSFANTTTRYDENDLGNTKRIAIRCGQAAPTTEHFRAFLETYKQIKLKLGAAGVIGIHCTHGFNRTGLIIVRFLVEELGLSLVDALERFKAARPPGIYKADYIAALFDHYKETGVVYQTPPNKNQIWSFPDPSSLPHYKQPTSPSGTTMPIEEDTGGEKIAGKQADAYYSEKVLSKIREICEGYGWRYRKEKFEIPGSQPISLERPRLEDLKDPRYRATYKSDGTRYILLALDGKNFLVDRKRATRQIISVLVDRRGKPLQCSLFDGELVKEEDENGNPCWNFLVFDIVMFEHLRLHDNDWDTRMDYVWKGLIGFRDMWREKTPERFDGEEVRVSPKRQWELSRLHELRDYIQNEVRHPTDGLIFTPLSMRWEVGQCDKILKWKPMDMNSVDFIGKWNKNKLYLGVHSPCKDADNPFAFISILDGDDVQYMSSLDGAIIECSYDSKTKGWKPMRVRTDKTVPNGYHTLVGVFESIRDDITWEELENRFR
jgi:mRNA-capping enzyme